jgi:hypothetical protein
MARSNVVLDFFCFNDLAKLSDLRREERGQSLLSTVAAGPIAFPDAVLSELSSATNRMAAIKKIFAQA